MTRSTSPGANKPGGPWPPSLDTAASEAAPSYKAPLSETPSYSSESPTTTTSSVQSSPDALLGPDSPPILSPNALSEPSSPDAHPSPTSSSSSGVHPSPAIASAQPNANASAHPNATSSSVEPNPGAYPCPASTQPNPISLDAQPSTLLHTSTVSTSSHKQSGSVVELPPVAPYMPLVELYTQVGAQVSHMTVTWYVTCSHGNHLHLHYPISFSGTPSL